MSRRIEKGFLIEKEPKFLCELCGSHEETRPYGPGGAEVCFSCGMKDEKEAERQFAKRLENAGV